MVVSILSPRRRSAHPIAAQRGALYKSHAVGRFLTQLSWSFGRVSAIQRLGLGIQGYLPMSLTWINRDIAKTFTPTSA
jgi:hypothetical protein